MAKSKNHTNHNQNRKAHRNGIRKPKKPRNPSTRGMDPKYLRNMKYSRKGNLKPKEQVRVYLRRKAQRERKLAERARADARKAAARAAAGLPPYSAALFVPPPLPPRIPAPTPAPAPALSPAPAPALVQTEA